MLHLAGFGLLSGAAGVLHLAAGLAVAGCSCLLLSWLTRPPGRRDA